MSKSGIDFIGDIHGHAVELEKLLDKMGYSKRGKAWKHSDRLAFFVGDYIDRGPQIPETLDIVRRMVDAGNAKAIMGNHEYNAICFHQEGENGGHLREHSIKNVLQHHETLKQFRNQQKEYNEYIEWFKTLPLYYETDQFRAVHASWDDENVKQLPDVDENQPLSGEMLRQSAQKGSELYNAFDETLKGKEMELPKDLTFLDKDGNERMEVRIKWWENPNGHTLRSFAVGKSDHLPDHPVENFESFKDSHYKEDEKPVFFGHYWLMGNPALYRNNICCLDYSVAKGGKLVAYRFDGEEDLMDEKLVFV